MTTRLRKALVSVLVLVMALGCALPAVAADVPQISPEGQRVWDAFAAASVEAGHALPEGQPALAELSGRSCMSGEALPGVLLNLPLTEESEPVYDICMLYAAVEAQDMDAHAMRFLLAVDPSLTQTDAAMMVSVLRTLLADVQGAPGMKQAVLPMDKVSYGMTEDATARVVTVVPQAAPSAELSETLAKAPVSVPLGLGLGPTRAPITTDPVEALVNDPAFALLPEEGQRVLSDFVTLCAAGETAFKPTLEDDSDEDRNLFIAAESLQQLYFWYDNARPSIALMLDDIDGGVEDARYLYYAARFLRAYDPLLTEEDAEELALYLREHIAPVPDDVPTAMARVGAVDYTLKQESSYLRLYATRGNLLGTVDNPLPHVPNPVLELLSAEGLRILNDFTALCQAGGMPFSGELRRSFYRDDVLSADMDMEQLYFWLADDYPTAALMLDYEEESVSDVRLTYWGTRFLRAFDPSLSEADALALLLRLRDNMSPAPDGVPAATEIVNGAEYELSKEDTYLRLYAENTGFLRMDPSNGELPVNAMMVWQAYRDACSRMDIPLSEDAPYLMEKEEQAYTFGQLNGPVFVAPVDDVQLTWRAICIGRDSSAWANAEQHIAAMAASIDLTLSRDGATALARSMMEALSADPTSEISRVQAGYLLDMWENGSILYLYLDKQ